MATFERWLSSNPEKARAELFLLAYSPVWMLTVAAVMFTGTLSVWGDGALMSFGCLVVLPMVVGPTLIRRRANPRASLAGDVGLKLNLWIWILVWAGSYFYSHYFFEYMGMYYGFRSSWHLEAEIMGSPSYRVPLFLYPLTQAYFLTYHTIMVLCLRRFKRSSLARQPLLTVLAVVTLAYAVAFAETFFMANETMAEYFQYNDRGEMLRWGSTMFGLIFVVSLPMVYRLEERPGERWSFARVALDSLAACMLILMLLDAWALIVPPLLR